MSLQLTAREIDRSFGMLPIGDVPTAGLFVPERCCSNSQKVDLV